jgi:hypothetical protein
VETIILDKREYHIPTGSLVNQEGELKNAQKLLEAPKKVSWLKRYWKGALVVAMVLVFVLLPGVSHSLKGQKEALIGLKGVLVVVEKNIRPEIERIGITRDWVKNDTELRLRKAGIRVLTEREWSEVPGTPMLVVNVVSFRVDTPKGETTEIVTCSINVQLWEQVTRANGYETAATVWETGTSGVVGIARIERIRESIGDAIDEFINAYLAANPKK